MEKEKIVKLFAENKILISQSVLDFLFENQDIIDNVKNYCLEKNLIYLDDKNLQEFLKNQILEIKLEFPEELGEFSIEEITLMLRNRFQFLSSVLIQNNLLKEVYSISKVERGKRSFEKGIVIGIVKDKTTYTFLLEDLSGSISINGEAEDIEKLNLDEVIGVEIVRENERFRAIKYFYPSFSFFRKIKNLDKEVLIEENSIVFENRRFEVNIENGAKVFLKDTLIFVLNFEFMKFYLKENYIENLILLLEKRHLNPTIIKDKRIYKEDFFLLKEIPEYIIVINSPINEKKFYKGVQIYFLRKGSKLYLKEGRFV